MAAFVQHNAEKITELKKKNSRFVFYRNWAVGYTIGTRVLQLIHDFLSSGNTVASFLYMFPVILVRRVPLWASGKRIEIKSLYRG